jgi:peptide/nickel transport system ATP-binding protein
VTEQTLLSMRSLSVTAQRRQEILPLVRDVDLQLADGQALGLVGESGSGKSMTIKAAVRLLPRGITASGEVFFDQVNVFTMSRGELSDLRARQVGLIHQDPRAHVNPTRTIRDFMIEGVVQSGQMSPTEAAEGAIQLMRDVGISDAPRRLDHYPHQLSGGLLQRVMIVAALLPGPRLIFADEPTTALDVTVQSEVMAILLEQIQQRHVSLLFVTHDLDLAAAVTDRIAVMYAGRIVESGSSSEVCETPRHPYTAALLGSRPSTTEQRRLVTIPGRPIAAFEAGDGCAFADRCAFAIDRCRIERPLPRPIGASVVACHRSEEIGAERLERLA